MPRVCKVSKQRVIDLNLYYYYYYYYYYTRSHTALYVITWPVFTLF